MTAHDLCHFIHASPSPFHCVAEAARRLALAGFQTVDEAAEPARRAAGSGGYVVRGGSIVAWRLGSAPPAAAGFRIVGAHTDSPNLRLKPRPEVVKEGYVQWGVEVYGGALLSTWLDRDLGISGRVAVRGPGGVELRLVRVDRPIARIPNLAIHLDREVNDRGLVLNRQTHLAPIVALAAGGGADSALQTLLAAEGGCASEELLGWDLGLHDVQPPVVGGLNGEFVFSPRLDNQASCFSALEALLATTDVPRSTAVVALFDHEEVGSGSERGAASTLLGSVLARLEEEHEDRAPGGLRRAAASSLCVSVDMAHGVHPNYADKHEPSHKPLLNGGPVVKTNVGMRYATDAETAARFRAACHAEEVPVQDFVTRSDLACGTTIGPITASGLGIRTVDVGCPMLSMHSIREQCGARDVVWMTRVLGRVLRG